MIQPDATPPQPNPVASGFMFGTGSVLAVVVACCGGCWLVTPSVPLPPPRTDSLPLVTARELQDAYRANEAAADRDYLGKWLVITGTVDRVTTSGRTVNVELDTGIISSVRCEMAAESGSAAANVLKGQSVRIAGYCKGKSISPYLEGCEFAK